MWVKVCGLGTTETVHAAIDVGADAIGFVFAPRSPRTIDPATVRGLIADVPADVETVGVFRNQPIAEVIAMATAAGVGWVQLHGDEPPSDHDRLHDLGFSTIRATSAARYAADEGRLEFGEDRLLIDAPVPGAGETFDASSLIADPPHRDWVLAGGLRPDNVAGLIAQLGPAGVDVSSGVESAPGVKSVDLIRAFVEAATSGR
ncbi:phosphoribosylanthranilate isomerase [Plantibacter sp. Mn2098]|uniref:phosphoribosylanthranilate isomerase n=1 Tax=Plantibacter sp. Mn2098 TaxID=3395266 RepID=UPI003BEC5813